jgi:hypothetical protein
MQVLMFCTIGHCPPQGIQAHIMKQRIELPGPVIVNRAVHTMAVIVIVLFAFHFARLSGFALTPVIVALVVALVAAASLGLKRSVTLEPETRRLVTTVNAFSIPLSTTRTDLSSATWTAVRADLPDLVVEAGTPADETVEIVRFRNAFGNREGEAAATCASVAAALQIEDRSRAH